MKMKRSFSFLVGIVSLFFASCAGDAEKKGVLILRVGHFPNVTHAQGLIGHHGTQQNKGWFESRLGPGIKIEWLTFNAGPSAMEAVLAGTVDLTYVGPNPAINAHVRSQGEEIRVIAGATQGGSALVVQGNGVIKAPSDFRGKKVATPQMGNTQDVSCRAWLTEQGYKITQTGGDVSVLPTQNPDQLALFKSHDIDAVWTVEPWVSRLEMEAQGKIFLEEKDSVTTVLVASARFLREKPTLAKKFAQAHAELNIWIQSNPEEAKKIVREELAVETTREMPAELLQHCWPRMHFSSEISLTSFEAFLKAAQKAGFLKEAGNLSRLVEIPQ